MEIIMLYAAALQYSETIAVTHPSSDLAHQQIFRKKFKIHDFFPSNIQVYVMLLYWDS